MLTPKKAIETATWSDSCVAPSTSGREKATALWTTLTAFVVLVVVAGGLAV